MIEVGKKYNSLTAIEDAKTSGYNKMTFVIFKCECGETKVIRGYSVECGNTKSCGCLRKQKGKDGLQKRREESKEKHKNETAEERKIRRVNKIITNWF
jgi:hypothetical protein